MAPVANRKQKSVAGPLVGDSIPFLPPFADCANSNCFDCKMNIASEMFDAIITSQTKKLKKLIEENEQVDLNTFRAGSGSSMLCCAVRQAQGNIATVNLLLEKGANVNFKNPQGMTPISWAVDEDNHAVANLLIAKGAKVDLTDAVLIDTLNSSHGTLNSSLGNAKMAEILIKRYEAARPKKPYSFWDLFKGRKNVFLNRASFVKHEEENPIPGEQKKPRKESAADMKEESHKFLRQALSSLFPDLPGPAAAQQSRPRAQPDRYTTTQTADKHKPDTHTTTQTADKHKPTKTKVPKNCICFGPTCSHSQADGFKLKMCTACKTAWYCSSACQKEDWADNHRVWCKATEKEMKEREKTAVEKTEGEMKQMEMTEGEMEESEKKEAEKTEREMKESEKRKLKKREKKKLKKIQSLTNNLEILEALD